MENTVTPRQVGSLFKRVSVITTTFDQEVIERAYKIAAECYSGREHWTGVSILEHTIGVLEVLAPFEPDQDSVVACLLHHVFSQNGLSLLELEEQFGAQVRSIVSGLHLLSHVTLQGRRSSIEDLRIMLLSVSDDMRVILISLCDRAHCLSYLHQLPKDAAMRLSQDVLQLFAPVAARLGIYNLKHELEDRAFPVVYPSDALHIAEQIERLEKERPGFLGYAANLFSKFLDEHGVRAKVEARTKHPYSAFLKMNRKNLTDIRSVHDFYAIRVIVDSEEECYQALGLLHKLAYPLPNRFKDYISFPKPNGYQSLHTTLAKIEGLPEDVFVEIQIRTQAMDREASYGVAAHWSYKEHGATRRALEKVQLHTMLMEQQGVGDEGESTTLVDHIFVLTPKGDIIEFPEGATPLDFAFQVHTDLGLSFRAARVNGSIVPLDYQLENGDVVEIIKDRTPRASPQWMQLLRMASSRSKLKRYLYTLQRPELLARGREIMNMELRKHHLPLLTTDLSIMRLMDGQTLTMQEREDALIKIGQGAERLSALLSRLDLVKGKLEEDSQASRSVHRLQRKDGEIALEDDLKMPIRYAKCCTPQEGFHENIIGKINREGEVMVHRKNCRMLRQSNPERQVKVWWR